MLLPPRPVVCPACGSDMLLLTDGFWCPDCRHLYPSEARYPVGVVLREVNL